MQKMDALHVGKRQHPNLNSKSRKVKSALYVNWFSHRVAFDLHVFTLKTANTRLLHYCVLLSLMRFANANCMSYIMHLLLCFVVVFWWSLILYMTSSQAQTFAFATSPSSFVSSLLSVFFTLRQRIASGWNCAFFLYCWPGFYYASQQQWPDRHWKETVKQIKHHTNPNYSISKSTCIQKHNITAFVLS